MKVQDRGFELAGKSRRIRRLEWPGSNYYIPGGEEGSAHGDLIAPAIAAERVNLCTVLYRKVKLPRIAFQVIGNLVFCGKIINGLRERRSRQAIEFAWGKEP